MPAWLTVDEARTVSLLDLLCPTRCEGCGEPGAIVCARCRRTLTTAAFRHRPSPCPAGMPPLWVVAAYDGPTRELLLAFKERGAAGLAAALAEPLAAAVSAGSEPSDRVVLVPVPSLPAAVRRRGDDVVELMARRTARRLRVAGVDARAVSLLAHRRVVADSAGLSAVQRAANLRGAFALRRGLTSASLPPVVVVVDDLVTTGATLCEAARALDAAGVVVRAAAAVAATMRRGDSRTARGVAW